MLVVAPMPGITQCEGEDDLQEQFGDFNLVQCGGGLAWVGSVSYLHSNFSWTLLTT